MINIDGKIINSLNESELYLFAILLNYGKESHPKNEVLKAKTGWAMNKLQATKKSLVEKGLLKVVSRYVGAEGKRVNSNEYQITTRLASKYNGKKESKKSAFEDVCMVKLEVLENEVIEIEVLENQVCEIRVHDFGGDFKVLKLSIIETIKQILKREREKTPHSKILELENEIDRLNAKIAFLEKPKHSKDLPSWDSEIQKNDSFKALSEKLQNEFKRFCMYRHNKADKGIVIDTVEQLLKRVILFKNGHSEEKIIASFDLCKEAGNVTFDPNFVVNREGSQSKDKPKEPQGFAYDLPNFQTAKQREWWFFQKFEFYKTLEILENRLINTTYYKLAYEKRQPEKLIQQLENEFPKLLDHPFKNDRWQNIQ